MDLKNIKTTLFGIIAAIPQIIAALSDVLPPKYANVATAVSGAIALYFAKDKNVTGGTVKQ